MKQFDYNLEYLNNIIILNQAMLSILPCKLSVCCGITCNDIVELLLEWSSSSGSWDIHERDGKMKGKEESGKGGSGRRARTGERVKRGEERMLKCGPNHTPLASCTHNS